MGLVMELCECSLDVWLTKSPPDNHHTALTLVRGPCAGLSFLHAKGMVHNDVKLKNVFVVHKGGRVEAKLGDLGNTTNQLCRRHLVGPGASW